MRGTASAIAAAALALCAPVAVVAETTPPPAPELAPYLQCVPYARALTGIQIYGDAHTWWEQAAGRYERGSSPRVGAVLAFVPHANMVLGHVAAVSRVIDSRTVLLDHANWSPIDGRRGQIEKDVRAIDVSPANDWSQVRVWYGPIGGIGTTAWPVHGFIYGTRTQLIQPRLAAAQPPVSQSPVSPAPSRAFMNAFAGYDQPSPQRRIAATQAKPAPKQSPRRDPIEAALARYGS